VIGGVWLIVWATRANLPQVGRPKAAPARKK
jgi:hypothetical protein